MIIDLHPELEAELIKLAAKNNLTPKQYATNILASWLEGQYRGEINAYIKNRTIDELATIKSLIIK